MKMRYLFFVLIVFAMCGIATSTDAAESRLEQFAESGTAAQIKQYLMNSPRFTQKQLDRALISALSNPNPRVLKMLLDAGANPNAKTDFPIFEGTDEGVTALAFAAEMTTISNNWNNAIILLKAGANPEAILYSEAVAFKIAEEGNDEAVTAMVKCGVNKNIRDYKNRTLYDYAKKNKNLSPRVREMLR